MITEMKAYISADLRVINCANDIIATSGETQFNSKMSDGIQLSGGRRDLFDDSYDEF